MFRSLGIVILTVMFLSACSSSGWIEPSITDANSKYADADACNSDTSVAERYHSKLKINPSTGSAPTPFAAPPRRKPPIFASGRPSHPFVVGLRRLIGLDRASTKALLGDPSSYQEDPPARIWSYNAGVCVLKVFFYPRVDIEEFRALTYEITDSAASANEEQTRGKSSRSRISNRNVETEKAYQCLAVLAASRDSPAAR